MKFIKDKKSCMLYPDDKFKNHWDLAISLVLVYISFFTPI